MPATPFIRLHYPKKLRTKINKVLNAIDKDDAPTRHRDALSAVIMELTDTGMTYFFLDPLRSLKMGFVMEQSAALGTMGVMKIMGPLFKNIISRMDGEQLRTVSKFIREIMD